MTGLTWSNLAWTGDGAGPVPKQKLKLMFYGDSLTDDGTAQRYYLNVPFCTADGATLKLATDTNPTGTWLVGDFLRVNGLNPEVCKAYVVEGVDATGLYVAESYNGAVYSTSVGQPNITRLGATCGHCFMADWLSSGHYVGVAPYVSVWGAKLTDMLARFDNDVLPFAPDVVRFLGGTNDATEGRRVEQFMSDYQAIRQKCLDNNILYVHCLLPARLNTNTVDVSASQRTKEVNAVAAEWCVANGIPVIDFWTPTVSSDGTYGDPDKLRDRLHMTMNGEWAMAKAQAAVLSNIMAGPSALPTDVESSGYAKNPLFTDTITAPAVGVTGTMPASAYVDRNNTGAGEFISSVNEGIWIIESVSFESGDFLDAFIYINSPGVQAESGYIESGCKIKITSIDGEVGLRLRGNFSRSAPRTFTDIYRPSGASAYVSIRETEEFEFRSDVFWFSAGESLSVSDSRSGTPLRISIANYGSGSAAFRLEISKPYARRVTAPSIEGGR